MIAYVTALKASPGTLCYAVHSGEVAPVRVLAVQDMHTNHWSPIFRANVYKARVRPASEDEIADLEGAAPF